MCVAVVTNTFDRDAHTKYTAKYFRTSCDHTDIPSHPAGLITKHDLQLQYFEDDTKFRSITWT